MGDFELLVGRGEPVGAKNFLASDIRAINAQLKAINPELRTAFMREAKSIGKKAESYVKPALPATAPLSGMNGKGSYGWNTQKTGKGKAVRPNQTSVQFRTSTGASARAMGQQTTSLVAVKVLAPMTVISDIAGRSGYSKPYKDRYGNIRRHKLNGQGEAMISGLGGRGSRFAWPAFESHQTDFRNQLMAVVEKYSAIANRKFK